MADLSMSMSLAASSPTTRESLVAQRNDRLAKEQSVALAAAVNANGALCRAWLREAMSEKLVALLESTECVCRRELEREEVFQRDLTVELPSGEGFDRIVYLFEEDIDRDELHQKEILTNPLRVRMAELVADEVPAREALSSRLEQQLRWLHTACGDEFTLVSEEHVGREGLHGAEVSNRQREIMLNAEESYARADTLSKESRMFSLISMAAKAGGDETLALRAAEVAEDEASNRGFLSLQMCRPAFAGLTLLELVHREVIVRRQTIDVVEFLERPSWAAPKRCRHCGGLTPPDRASLRIHYETCPKRRPPPPPPVAPL